MFIEAITTCKDTDAATMCSSYGRDAVRLRTTENRRIDRRRDRISNCEFNSCAVTYLSRRCICIFVLATLCSQRTISFLYYS